MLILLRHSEDFNSTFTRPISSLKIVTLSMPSLTKTILSLKNAALPRSLSNLFVTNQENFDNSRQVSTVSL